MFNRTRRYLQILRVFIKYRLFYLLYREIHNKHISDRKCSCDIDIEHRRDAARLRDAFEELGPTFIKLGQAMSRRPDLIPGPYILELENLVDRVKPMDFDYMRESFEGACICERAYDVDGDRHDPRCYRCHDILEMFDEFDTMPIASASIAQIYRGKLHGSDVAIKIARPRLVDVINMDLVVLHDLKFVFTKIFGGGKKYEIEEFLNEFRYMLHSELDFPNEALNMERFAINFKDHPEVKVPKVYWDYTRDNILVMDYMEGIPLNTPEAKNIGRKEQEKYVDIITRSYFKQVYIDGFFHADPHAGNIVALDDAIAYIDFGAVGRIESDLKKRMFEFFYAVYEKDTDKAAEVFLTLGEPMDHIDRYQFKLDVDDLITRQHLGKLRERRSDAYARLGMKYNIALPSIFFLLGRALFLVESTCLELDPNFNLIDRAEPVMKEAVKEAYSPGKVVAKLREKFETYLEVFRNLPDGLNDVFEIASLYRARMLEEDARAAARQKTLERIFMSIFLSLLLVSSVLILLFTSDPQLMLLGIGGFVTSLVLGLIIVIRSWGFGKGG